MLDGLDQKGDTDHDQVPTEPKRIFSGCLPLFQESGYEQPTPRGFFYFWEHWRAANSHYNHLYSQGQTIIPTSGGLVLSVTQLKYFVVFISISLTQLLHSLGKVHKSSNGWLDSPTQVTQLSQYGTISHNSSPVLLLLTNADCLIPSTNTVI